MKKYPALFLLFLLCILWLLFSLCIASAAEALFEKDSEDTLELTLDGILEQSDQQALDDLVSNTGLPRSVTFSGLVRSLMTGRIPFQPETVRTYVTDLFFSEILNQKQMALQILLIVLSSAVFSNFIRVFEKNQIAEISFYMMYLLVSTMLLRSFSGMDTLVAETLSHITRLIKLLLPAYLASIVFSAGSLSALGFYQAATVTIALLQGVIMRGVLPLLQFYLAVLMLNQMTKEDLFSRFAQLLQTIVDWSLKTVIGVAVGLQTVQCLIAPGVDSFKNSAAHRIAKAIPGIGNLFDAASETVTGSAIVIRNAIGTGGMLLIAAICLLPLLKLLTCILIFRLLCAIIQPICEKRMLACVESISCAAALLLRILCGSMAVLLILLAMILSSLKGG